MATPPSTATRVAPTPHRGGTRWAPAAAWAVAVIGAATVVVLTWATPVDVPVETGVVAAVVLGLLAVGAVVAVARANRSARRTAKHRSG